MPRANSASLSKALRALGLACSVATAVEKKQAPKTPGV